MEKLNLTEITNRLTDDMIEYGMISNRITRNAIDVICKCIKAAGWDKPETNTTPDLSEYQIIAIDQEDLELKPFYITSVKSFKSAYGETMCHYCYSVNGSECPITNLDTYTTILLAQAITREYEKFLKK